MKLAILAEARYHRDPNEYILQTFFNMEDEDQAEGFQWWSAKSEYRITIEFEDEQLLVSHVVYEPGEQYPASIHVMGDDEPLPAEWELTSIEVFKRVFPK